MGLWRALSGIGILIDLHSLSLSLSETDQHRYSVDQSMHSVYTLCLYGSHCRCCNISHCPIPFSVPPHTVRSTMPYSIDHPLVPGALFFEIL